MRVAGLASVWPAGDRREAITEATAAGRTVAVSHLPAAAIAKPAGHTLAQGARWRLRRDSRRNRRTTAANTESRAGHYHPPNYRTSPLRGEVWYRAGATPFGNEPPVERL